MLTTRPLSGGGRPRLVGGLAALLTTLVLLANSRRGGSGWAVGAEEAAASSSTGGGSTGGGGGSEQLDAECNHCRWTAEWACPGGDIPGTKGWAEPDESVCFNHCCPDSCAAYSVITGSCWRHKAPREVPYNEALARTDGYKLVNVALGTDCRETWLLSKFATAVTGLVRHGIESLKLPMKVTRFLPPGADLHVSSITGAIVVLDNVTVTKIQPSVLKYGFCYDDQEWRVDQNWVLRNTLYQRPPDRMMVVSSEIQATVKFDYELYQDLLLGKVPLGDGSAQTTVKGFLGLDLDLSRIATKAISDCDGKFGMTSLALEVNSDLLGENLGIEASGAMTKHLVESFAPLIASQMHAIICHGNGLADVNIVLHDPPEGEGDVDLEAEPVAEVERFRGIVEEINEQLASSFGMLGAVQRFAETDEDRRRKMKRDCERLRKAGKEVWGDSCLGMKRFQNVDAAPPPPAPPAQPSWSDIFVKDVVSFGWAPQVPTMG
ncbi:hypothetical protein EMIHUDRAFT_466544 [Emiliania huxleyi CCMP1516]|uniref:Band 7 domain-containing protein n=3 Tax=Emiliania huxleyi TaxID=2903 RepID=A0A0D3KXA2_EMIH1|nr:hypothetical protein EMIHUDRAFT_466544 [Emiliania huxleyi CCMP1516]EOD40387.1 hypothetical protein EMIHUDRAFT_466544 [Emiliania huxleyi CCMP1516]|eukprot:XP_005792816.1 hypothetical protein EMIHUDRAFT_466544 [Emiliania huxleyi CCMP1516]